jgi:hypothetical protein
LGGKRYFENKYLVINYGKTPGCGNIRESLTTTFNWKLLKGTRLIVVPNGNNVKDWKIRRILSKD